MLYKLSNSCLTDILVALIMLAVLFLPAESFFLSFLTGSCTGVHERSAAHNFVGLCAKGTPALPLTQTHGGIQSKHSYWQMKNARSARASLLLFVTLTGVFFPAGNSACVRLCCCSAGEHLKFTHQAGKATRSTCTMLFLRD
jgi:hypothetical protein